LPKDRQVAGATYGLTVNFGGFGNNVVTLILKRSAQNEVMS